MQPLCELMFLLRVDVTVFRAAAAAANAESAHTLSRGALCVF